jgi:hypothetical protein
MLNTLIRYIAQECFQKEDINYASLDNISLFVDFQDWIQLREQFQPR